MLKHNYMLKAKSMIMKMIPIKTIQIAVLKMIIR